MDNGGLERAGRLVAAALAASPAGLLTDLDGTLAPIVRDPGAVRTVPGISSALARLAGRLAVVGVVSGRSAADVRRILGAEGDALLVVGNHGLEWLEPGARESSDTPELLAARGAVRAALEVVGNELGPGIRVEDKGLSATIHYRAAPDPGAARRRITHALAAVPDARIQVRQGRKSVELRPVGVGDKGTAVTRVVERYRLRGLVVAGDDVTDLDMFRAASALRDAGRLRSAVVGVGGGGEVPAAVAQAADVMLAGPREVAALFAELAGTTGA